MCTTFYEMIFGLLLGRTSIVCIRSNAVNWTALLSILLFCLLWLECSSCHFRVTYLSLIVIPFYSFCFLLSLAFLRFLFWTEFFFLTLLSQRSFTARVSQIGDWEPVNSILFHGSIVGRWNNQTHRHAGHPWIRSWGRHSRTDLTQWAPWRRCHWDWR